MGNRRFVTVTILVLLLGGASAHGSGLVNDDEVAYFGTVTLKGVVEILNHPTLGRVPGSNTYLVFQRKDCKQCTIGTWTDQDGRYELHAGPGVYRLIVRDGFREGETWEMLAPDQQRWVTLSSSERTTQFDVRLLLRDRP